MFILQDNITARPYRYTKLPLNTKSYRKFRHLIISTTLIYAPELLIEMKQKSYFYASFLYFVLLELDAAFFEPTDRRKASKVLCRNNLIYSSPNIAELRAMAKFIEPTHSIKADTTLEEIVALYKIVEKCVDFLLITLGEKGVVTVKKGKQGEPNVQAYNIPDVLNNVENVSGAGDCFASGFIHGILQGLPENLCISIGFKSAKGALLSKKNVPTYFDL